MLYQRFHLFYAPSDFHADEVALACLFTASKMSDTNKRLQDVILASYAFRYPELLPPAPTGTSERDWMARAMVAESDVDSETLQQERARLLSLEKWLLQSICFHFELRAPQILRWTLKLAKHHQGA